MTEVWKAEELREHVERLAGEIGERNVFHPHALHRAEAYINQTFTGQGYEVLKQEYEVRSVRCANLVANKIGRSRPGEIILVGAHYDSVLGSPGANDNGSGVAALLEIARLLRPLEMRRSVRFVAFVNEEPPFFYSGQQGSQLYADEMKRRDEDIRLMLSLETMGYFSDRPGSQSYPPLFRFFYPDQANFIALVSNLSSRKAMHRLAKAFRTTSDFPLEHVATFSFVPGVDWSDHRSFWRHGYRALMVTDTAFYRYPYYHSAGDTPDKIDYQRLAEVTNGLARAIRELADRDEQW